MFYRSFNVCRLLVFIAISSCVFFSEISPLSGQTYYLNDDFEDGDKVGWTESTGGRFDASTSVALNGTYSLKHVYNNSAASNDQISYLLSGLSVSSKTTTWQFQLRHGMAPSSNNNWAVFLFSNDPASQMNPGGTADGYAVGVNYTGSDDMITLWRIDNGVATAIITSAIDWDIIGTGTPGGIKVTRTSAGNWELFSDNDGGFDNLVSIGTGTDNTYTTATYFGIYYKYSSTGDLNLRADDISISQPATTGNSIVEAGAGSEPASISSLYDTQGEAILNFDFKVTDDGATPATDSDPTKINQIVISEGTGDDITSYAAVLDGALLTDGTNSQTANITINASDITISNIDISNLGFIADNGNKTYTLKIWLKPSLASSTIDGDNFAFLVNRGSFTVEGSGSSAFLSGNGTDIESGSSNNAVDVIATKLLFVQEPSNTSLSAPMSPDPTVEAVDENDNRDTDYATAITVSSDGTMTGDPVSGSWTNGLATFSGLTHTVAETGRTLTASSGALTNGISGNFDILNECGSESFTNSNATGSYANNSFVGDNSVTWTYVQSRDENGDANGSGITGSALMLRRLSDASKVTSSSVAGGIADFSVNLYKGFTGGGSRQVELYINGVSKGTSTVFDDYLEHTFTVTGINISGNVIVELRNITANQIIVDNINWTCYSASCTAPTAQPTGISFSAVTSSSMTINWSGNGDGDGRIVVVKEASSVISTPVDGTAHTANTVFGSGDDIGTNEYVVYRGNGSSVNITGLSGNTTYYVAIFEYNNTDNCYYTTSPLTGNQLTPCGAPSTQASSVGFSGINESQMTVSWTRGGTPGDGVIVLAKQGSAVDANPVDGSTYTANAAFGTGTQIGTGNYVVYMGAGTSVNVTALSTATTYYYKVYEYNCSGANSVFNTSSPAAGIQATNSSSCPVTSLIISEVADPGDASSGRFIEIYNAGSIGIDFSAETWWISMQTGGSSWDDWQLTGTIGPGEFYIIAQNGSQFTSAYGITAQQIAGGNIGTGDDGYFIYEGGDGHGTGTLRDAYGVIDVDGSGQAWEYTDSRAYRNSGISDMNATWTAGEWTIGAANVADMEPGSHTCDCPEPCLAPATQASNISFTNISGSSMNVSWTNGGGSGRIVIMNTSNSFTAPTDGTSPTANSVYGGSGEQVIFNGTSSNVTVTGLSPGTTYWFRVYDFNCTGISTTYYTATGTNNPLSQATITCSAPTTAASNILFSSVSNNSMNVSWTKGDGEYSLLVASASPITGTPANSSTYTANATFNNGQSVLNAGEFIMYSGTSDNLTILGLSSSTAYYFTVFEFNCAAGNENYYTTNPPTGSQTTTAAAVGATFQPGDLIVLGLCSNTASCLGTSSGDDEISFFCCEDITTGTTFEMTDNGWERLNANQWGNTEGLLQATRTGATIPAGTVITFRFSNGGTYSGFQPDADWSFAEIHGVGGTDLIMNSGGDQIFFMQGGTWNNGTNGDHNATITDPNILFGFNSNVPWAADGTTKQSNEYPGLECFDMMPSGATDHLKYVGDLSPATQREWIDRVDDPDNWQSYGGCATYYAGAPDYTNGYSVTINVAGFTAGVWTGARGDNWFECGNWQNMAVPVTTTNVLLPATDVSNNCVIGDPSADGYTEASCNDLTNNLSGYSFQINNAASVLDIYGDYTNNSTFTHTAGVVNFKGTLAQALSGSNTSSFYNLTINNSSATGVSLGINSSIKPTGVLTLTDGQLILNSNKMTILNGATTAITGGSASSYIVSETDVADNTSILRWNMGSIGGNHVFPFGTVSGYYIPVTFNNNGNTSGNVAISTRPTAADDNLPWPSAVSTMGGPGTNLTSAADRWWEITTGINPIVGGATITFSYVGTENATTTDPTDIRGVQHWTGTYWNDGKGGAAGTVTTSGNAGVIGATVGSVLVTGITEYSPFIVVRAAIPLPVELLDFSGELVEEHVLLKWSTANEINNDYFTVERSADGKNFSEILFHNGAGNSNEPIHYSDIDRKPLPATSYYRLRQTDFNGQFTYSNIISVQNSVTSNLSLIRFNQNDNQLFLQVDNVGEELYYIQICDMNGRLIYKTVTADNSIQISTSTFSAGIYNLIINNGYDMQNRKFIIK